MKLFSEIGRKNFTCERRLCVGGFNRSHYGTYLGPSVSPTSNWPVKPVKKPNCQKSLDFLSAPPGTTVSPTTLTVQSVKGPNMLENPEKEVTVANCG